MTREEAIALMKSAQLMLVNPTTNEPVSDLYEALDMAIEALKQKPIYYPPCQDCHTKMDEIVRAYDNVKSLDDAVSKQVVKEQMLKYGFHAPDMTVTEFVEDLPPVIPKREQGEYNEDYKTLQIKLENAEITIENLKEDLRQAREDLRYAEMR